MDAEALVAVCDPEIRFRSRITELEGAAYDGHPGVRRYIANLADAFERISAEQSDVIAGPDRAVFNVRFRGTGRGSGVEVGGVGDVAPLAAELVGEEGEVVGIDRASEPLATARARAEARSPANATFLEGDAAKMPFDRSFDAVVGRYVLMFQEDPVAVLQGLTAYLRPGGVVVFHEPEWACARSIPPSHAGTAAASGSWRP